MKSNSQRKTSRRRPVKWRSYVTDLLRTGRLPAFLLSVGLGVVLVAFAASDDFLVDTVVIRGNSIVYADAVVESSGAIGESIFRVNSEDVARQVAAHPAIASAQVRAELPDRLIVTVVEREPAIVWQTGERAVLVDEEGWVLAEGTSDGLPRVVELDGELPRPGARLPVEYIAAVAYLDERFMDDVAIEYQHPDGFSVHLSGSRVIALGSPDQLPVKLTVVESIQSLSPSWSRLDVRDPDRPVYQ